MPVDKSKIGLIFKSPRATKERQEVNLREAGASHIVEVGVKVQTWRQAVNAARSGDTVYVYALALVPTKRGEDKLSPSAQITEFMVDLHSRGAVVHEVYTGRNSGRPRERMAMIQDAHNALRAGARPMPEMGRKPGRPEKTWSDDELQQARAAWFSKDYATNEAAARHMPAGFGSKRAWQLWGPSGRPYKSKKR